MNFKNAFVKLYEEKNKEDELDNPFFLYSKMSDLCSSSYEDKEKVLLYYKINRETNLFSLIRKQGRKIYDQLMVEYQKVSSLISLDKYEEIIILTYKIIEKKIEESNTIIKSNNNQTVIVNTQSNNVNSNIKSNDNMTLVKFFVGMFVGIIISCFPALMLNWSWTIWQIIIGISGGLLITLIIALIVSVMEEIFLIEKKYTGSIALGIILCLNFILFLIFKEKYEIIFYIYSSLIIIECTSLCHYCFDMCEEGWGAINILEIIIQVIFMISGIIII